MSRCSRSPAVNQLASLCNSGENDAAVLDRIEAPVVVKRRRNTGDALGLCPSDMSLVHFTFATRSDCHYARRVVRVNLRGSFRVPFFRLYIQDNVGCGEKHHVAPDDPRTLSARWKSSDPVRSEKSNLAHLAAESLA